jgi:predicted secreted protein
MTITSAIVLFAVIWFMVLFLVLPWRLTTQGEAGRVEPGTPESAPADPQMGLRIKLVTAISVVLWLVIAGVIVSGWIGVEDLDFFGRM